MTSVFNLAVSERFGKAIYNSPLQPHTVAGRDGHTRHAPPQEAVALPEA